MDQTLSPAPKPAEPLRLGGLQSRLGTLGDRELAWIVGFLAVAIFLNSFPGAFLLDDVPIIVNGPYVKEFNLRGIFTTDYWGTAVNSGLYRPFVVLTYALNRALFGPAPLSFHLVNVVLHGLASALFFLFARGLGLWVLPALLAALLFAFHPIHGEAVNMVVGRADILATLFTLGALRLDALDGRKGRLLAFACFVLGLMCKEQAYAIPPLLLLMDAHRRGGLLQALKDRSGYYAGLAAFAVAWRVGTLRLIAGKDEFVHPHITFTSDNPLSQLPPLERFVNALKIQGLYLEKLFVPNRLKLVYGRYDLDLVPSLTSPKAIAILLVTALALGAALWFWRKGSVAALAVLFYVGAVIPTANIFMVLDVNFAERIAYLPSLATCLFTGALLQELYPLARRWARILAVAAAAAYLGWLGYYTVDRNPIFKSQLSTWSAVAQIPPVNARVLYYLGSTYGQLGRYQEAEDTFLRSIELDPRFPDNWPALLEVFKETGHQREVIARLLEIPEARPFAVNSQYIIARNMVGWKKYEEALYWLDLAEPLFVKSPEFWWLRGICFENLGRPLEAEAAYLESLEREFSSNRAMLVAKSMVNRKDYEAAWKFLTGIDPRYMDADLYNALGITLAELGKYEEAAEAFRKAAMFVTDPAPMLENAERAEKMAREKKTAPR